MFGTRDNHHRETGLFGHLFSRLLGERHRPEPPAPGPAVREAGTSLDEALQTMEGLLRSGAHDTAVSTEAPRSDPERERARRQEADRQALLAEILALHGSLGTHLEEADLERLARLLVAHGGPAPLGEAPTLAERIERCVLRQVYRRSGERAWDRLQGLMGRAGQEWPVAQDLALGRTPEEYARVLDQCRREVRRHFLEAPPPRTADLMLGRVEVWSDYYPSRGSALWREAALRGVGGALRALHFAAVIESWLWRPPELEERLRLLLQEQIQAVQGVVSRPPPSVAEAVRVADGVNRLCQDVIPAAVWDLVGEPLQWDETHPGGLHVPTLARGATRLDPVCGMALTADRVADRASWEGRTWYFCAPACRAAFQADPARYAVAAPIQ